MTDAEALSEIHRLGSLGRVRLSRHARERSTQRGASLRDVCHAAATAASALWQSDRDSWRADGGVDLDGDPLTLIVDIEADLIIITLF